MADRVARDEAGNVFRLDSESGQWVPATPEAINLMANPVAGSITSFIEGATGVVSIAEMLSGSDSQVSEALSDVNPVAQGTGMAASVVGGAGLARGASATARGLGLTGKGRKIIEGLQAAEDRIPVPRNFKTVVRGADPGTARGAAGGLAGAGQAVLEGSQVLRGAAPGLSPNIGRQAATNTAALRPFGITPAAGGKVGRKLGSDAKQATDDLYDAVIAKPDAQISTAAFQDLAKNIKATSVVEQTVFKETLDLKTMTPKQILNRRKAIAKVNAETSDDIVRDQSQKVLDLIDSIIDSDDAFNAAKLADADESWRFLQALRAGLGQGEQISNSRWTNELAKFFPEEFGLARVGQASKRGRKLSQQGQESINAALEIETAGGVKTPPEGLTAIDFLLGGGALLGGTGAGIFRE